MKNEEQVFCSEKTGSKGKSECRGALMRDHRMSKMEEAIGHRKYICNKCNKSWKFGINVSSRLMVDTKDLQMILHFIQQDKVYNRPEEYQLAYNNLRYNVKKADECLEQLFVLSTSHITKEDNYALEDCKPLIVYEQPEYAWIVVIPDNIVETRSQMGEILSNAFWNILQYVQCNHLDCTRIQFDCDGIVRDDFPQFDW